MRLLCSVRQVGYLQRLYRDALSTEHKTIQHGFNENLKDTPQVQQAKVKN